MRKIFIYGSLLILFAGCNSNSTTGEAETSAENTIQEEVDSPPEAIAEMQPEVVEMPAKTQNCSIGELHVYLNDSDNSGTNIRETPRGDVVMQLKKEEGNEEYFLILTEAKDGWFKVKSPISGMEDDIQIPNREGWIHGSVIAVNTRNYGGQDLELLDKPKSGNVVGIIKDESFGLSIKDICEAWVQVEFNGIIGWIEDSWLCGNPLTTCS